MRADPAARHARLFALFRHENIARRIARNRQAELAARDVEAEAATLCARALRSWEGQPRAAEVKAKAKARPARRRDWRLPVPVRGPQSAQ